MKHIIEIDTFAQLSERLFKATGTVNGKQFTSRSIVYNGNVIFKLFEDGVIKPKSESIYSVGEKMSVASVLGKYSQGKIDKRGKPANDPKNLGIGIVIRQQKEIDRLKLKIETLEAIISKNDTGHDE